MNIQKTAQLVAVGVLAVTMTACSTFRGPRPIDPNDDKQFENLPPAPAVEALPSSEPTPPVIAETAPETPETGSANLGSAIESSVITTESSTASTQTNTGSGDLNDLLKTRVFYFDTNISDITAITYGSLNAHAKYLAANPQARLQISGHTDERGTREYNLALGERRANTVARYLVGAGVNPGQLSVVSYGKEKPAVEGSNEEAWAKCRRVELDYVSTAQ